MQPETHFLNTTWGLVAITGVSLIVLGAGLSVLLTSVYKHIVAFKYLFSGWKAVVPIISALPAALGVFLLVLVFAIMDGFANETREMTRGTLSDIIVDAHLEGLPYYDEYIARIKKIDGVEAATPVILTPAMVRFRPHRAEYPSVEELVKPVVKPCLLIGIRPDEKAEMGRFTKYLQEQKNGHLRAATLLSVPAEIQKPGEPPRPGCIAGTGLVGTPREMRKTQLVQQGVGGFVVTALILIVLGIGLVLFRRIARRRGLKNPWALLCLVLAVLSWLGAVGLIATALVMPLVPSWTVPVTRSQVIDWPLIDYGDPLVVSTIPLGASGAMQLDVGGVPKVSTRVFSLVDTFKSGYWEADSTHVYVDFKTAQQMTAMDGQAAAEGRPAAPARASQIQVKIKDPAQGRVLREKLRAAWADLANEKPDIGIMHLAFNTWEDQQKMILTVVEVEKNVTVLMLSLMFLGFGVLIALISYVMAYIKSRDVGILKAVGARDAGVGSMFLGYGFVIGLAGMTVGMVAALLVVQNLDAIEIWVNTTLDINIFPRDMYYFEHIPRNLSVAWCVGVGTSVLVLSTLASLAGGLLAALKQPVEALRYE